MKKNLFALVLILALAAALCGCGGGETADGGLSIVCTVFPQYDFTREILGNSAGGAELTLLTESGADMHSYQPSAADVAKILDCDLFIYVGGESDSWAADLLESPDAAGIRALSLMGILGDRVREEELTEGMQAEDAEPEETEYDEHVWLSLKNAGFICQAIADALCELDPGGAELYTQNCKDYNLNGLLPLDARYQEMTESAARRELIMADRFPFRYLTEDYGLTCYAAFPGCSAETEASFSTIAFLAGKTDELSLPVILVTESSDRAIAETVAANTESGGKPVLTLNAMQSITAEDIAAGVSYLSVMEENLAVLTEALN